MLKLLLIGACIVAGGASALDVKSIRNRRLERISASLSGYKSLVEKILSAESKEKEFYQSEKKAIDEIELDAKFRTQVNNYLLEEHRNRLKDLRNLVAVAGSEFNKAVETYQDQAKSELAGRVMSYGSTTFTKTELGIATYGKRLKDFVSPTLLANSSKIEVKAITSNELIKVNGTDYAPNFKWGSNLMNDGQFTYQYLPEYVDFLNGNDTPNFALASDGSITFKGRSYEFTPTVIKEKLYVSLAHNDPDAYKTWKERVDSLINAKLLRIQIMRLKRSLSIFERAVRTPSVELHASDRIPPFVPPQGEFLLLDRFGRDLTVNGVPLLDWDGYLANPALKFSLKTTGSATKSLNVVLISSNNKVHFSHTPESGCYLDANSARKHLLLAPGFKASEFLVSFWPDRDGKSDDYEIEVYYWFGNETKVNPRIEIPSSAKVVRLAVHVEDLDSEESSGVAEVITAVPPFPFVAAPPDAPFLTIPFPFQSQEFSITESERFTINLTTELDKTGFFTDDDSGATERKACFKQAAMDLSYFIKTSLGRTARGDSIALANGDGNGEAGDAITTTNRYAYKDFLIYLRGVPGTSEPAGRAGRVLTDESKSVGIVEKGAVTYGEVLIAGHPDRFIVDPLGEKWWTLNWDPGQLVDLYSWASHEELHAFAFSEIHAAFKHWKTIGKIDSPTVVAYHGREPVLNQRTGHLDGEIDVESQRGAFGVIDGNMPARTYLPTKLDLTMLAASGYGLMPNRLWGELTFQDELKLNLTAGRYVNSQMKAIHGIPPYYWKIEAGEIPRGLVLNSYTGEISGTPESAGEYHFILSVQDSSNTNTIPLYLYKNMNVAQSDSR